MLTTRMEVPGKVLRAGTALAAGLVTAILVYNDRKSLPREVGAADGTTAARDPGSARRRWGFLMPLRELAPAPAGSKIRRERRDLTPEDLAMRRLWNLIAGMFLTTIIAGIGLTMIAYTSPLQARDGTLQGWWHYVQAPQSDWDPAGFLALLPAVALPLFLAVAVGKRKADERNDAESVRAIGLEVLTLLSSTTAAILAWMCLPSAIHGAGFPLLNGVGTGGLALLFVTLAALAAPSDALVQRSRAKRERDVSMLMNGARSLSEVVDGSRGVEPHAKQGSPHLWWPLIFTSSLSALLVAMGTTLAFYVHPETRVVLWLIALLAAWQVFTVVTFLNQYAARKMLQVMGRPFAGSAFLAMASFIALLFLLTAAWQSLKGYWFISGVLLVNEIVAPWLTYRMLRRSRLVMRLVLRKIHRRSETIRRIEEPDHPLLALG